MGSDKKLSFRGHAELQRQTVHVRGDQINLVPGMRGQARIITERRSLLSFAFEPLQFVRENFGEAQST